MNKQERIEKAKADWEQAESDVNRAFAGLDQAISVKKKAKADWEKADALPDDWNQISEEGK